MTLIESEQSRDIQLTQIVRGPFVLRYASYRKGEDAKLDLRSEDYIVCELTPGQAIFALCDGVGSSYYGNIGSQFLGETMLNWLGNVSIPKSFPNMRDNFSNLWLEKLTNDLKNELDNKIKLATSIIQNRKISSQSELIQLAEKTQRDDFGTQSNFAGGIIWPKSDDFPNGLVILFWLGNARIRIFRGKEDLTQLTKWGGNPEQLKEVWSSKEGVVGHVYSYLTDLSKITSVIAYSDGMEGAEEKITPNIQGANLESLIRQAQSIKDDDVSYFEIFLAENGIDEYSDDIVSTVRSQYSTIESSAASDSQYEVKELRRKNDYLEKANNKLSDELQRNKKINKYLVAGLVLLTLSICMLIMGNFLVKPRLAKITPTSTTLPTFTLIPPSITPSITPSIMPTIDPSLLPPPIIDETPTNLPTITETATPETPTITSSMTFTATP